MEDVRGSVKPKRLKSSPNLQPQKKQSKLCCNFLFKTIIVTIFLIIIPLFPSQAPEFINQSIFTRSWELLHLIFVGIAVSYGLFSRRNDGGSCNYSAVEETSTSNSKIDSAQSYVSTLLEVSSVFDDDSSSTGSSDDGSKIRTWSSQYYRNEPMVVVAKEDVVLNGNRTKNPTAVGERPLLLPVRSLKSRVSDQSGNEHVKGDVNSGDSRSSNLSNSSSRETSNHSEMISSRSFRSGVDGGIGCDSIYIGGDGGISRSLNGSGSTASSQEYLNGSESIRNGSLISNAAGWTRNDLKYVDGHDGFLRSLSRPDPSSKLKADLSNNRSNETTSGVSEGLYGGSAAAGKGVEDKEEKTVVLPSPIPWRSRSGRLKIKAETESLMKRIDRSPNTENYHLLRSSSTNTSPDKHNSSSRRSSPRANTSPDKHNSSSLRSSPREPSPSFVSSLESQAKTIESIRRRRTKYKASTPPPAPPPPPRPIHISSLPKSRSCLTNDEVSRGKELRRSVWSEPGRELSVSEKDELLDQANVGVPELITSSGVDGNLKGKSDRTMRAGEIISEARRREMEADRLNTNGMTERKRLRNGDVPPMTDGPAEEKTAARSSNPLELFGYPKETRDFLEHVFAETDGDESEAEEGIQDRKSLDNDYQTVDEGGASGGVLSEGPPDVDKKADEFIAKFREQIRLQRIDSLRRSSGQANRNTSR